MTDKDLMVLQSFINSENILVGPYGEAYPACHDGDQAVNIKAEEVSDTEEEVDPVQITIQEMKAEPEVSCMFLYVSVRQISHVCKNASCFQITICLAVCLHVWSLNLLLMNIACDVLLPYLLSHYDIDEVKYYVN
jgi:hypothetical protein